MAMSMPPGQIQPKVEAPRAPAAPAELPSRKIIYNADVRVVVADFDQAEQQVRQLVKDHKGYVAQAEITGSAGAPRSGRWRVRVPVDQFEAFLEALVHLGVPERNSTDSKDVTEEFYDLEARIKNKKVEEERLRQHLEKSTGKLDEILAVERELSRVRGEVERFEGRLRMLANLAALTTVNLTIREEKDYVPPQTPTFGGRVSGTFADSWSALVRFGQGLVLIGAALVPWLPVLAVVALAVWLLVRRVAHRPVVDVQPVPPPAAPSGG